MLPETLYRPIPGELPAKIITSPYSVTELSIQPLADARHKIVMIQSPKDASWGEPVCFVKECETLAEAEQAFPAALEALLVSIGKTHAQHPDEGEWEVTVSDGIPVQDLEATPCPR